MTKDDAIAAATALWGPIVSVHPVPHGGLYVPKSHVPGGNGWFVFAKGGQSHTLGPDGRPRCACCIQVEEE